MQTEVTHEWCQTAADRAVILEGEYPRVLHRWRHEVSIMRRGAVEWQPSASSAQSPLAGTRNWKKHNVAQELWLDERFETAIACGMLMISTFVELEEAVSLVDSAASLAAPCTDSAGDIP